MQEGIGEERLAAKSKPMMSLVSRSMAGSSTAPSSTTPTSLRCLSTYSHGLGLTAGAGKPVSTGTVKAMLRIKEVEMVNSVDSMQGLTPVPE